MSPEIVEKFFLNYSAVADGIPPTNVFNYDETNLTDDPGAQKKFLFRKGVKYTEKVMDTTKTSISIMFCGSAAGDLLPPYVVYKGETLWTNWCLEGPSHCRYYVTKNGWFDMGAFENWFETVFLPAVTRLDGPKVLVGDNLTSHISLNVIRQCRSNNIQFVCLPPHPPLSPLIQLFLRQRGKNIPVCRHA